MVKTGYNRTPHNRELEIFNKYMNSNMSMVEVCDEYNISIATGWRIKKRLTKNNIENGPKKLGKNNIENGPKKLGKNNIENGPKKLGKKETNRYNWVDKVKSESNIYDNIQQIDLDEITTNTNNKLDDKVTKQKTKSKTEIFDMSGQINKIEEMLKKI